MSRATTFEDDASRQLRLTGLLALVFIFAQLLFAAHAAAAPGPLSDHATQSCEVCLAGAVADDPHDLGAAITPPAIISLSVSRPVAANIVVAITLLAASPRGPPVH